MTDDRDPRPDHEMEGRVSGWLTDTDLSPDEAHAGLDRLLDDFPVTPQARRRILGRWLDRDEGAGRRTTAHDPPSNPNRRTRLMLSATGLAAAFAILALTVNVIDTEPAPPNQAGATHVVAADGSGQYTTIQAAVDAAAPGDTVSVLPGTYTEAVVIKVDLTLVGDGPREEIILMAPEDGPVHPTGFSWLPPSPYALVLIGTEGEVRGLTFAGTDSRLFVDGGAPMVEGLLMQGVGQAYAGTAVTGAVVVKGGATPTFVDNELVGGGGLSAFEDSDPIIERNVVHESGAIDGDFGADAVIRDNTITGAGRQGITFLGATTALVTGNTIADKEFGVTVGDGISVTVGGDFAPTIEGNSITGATQVGINLTGGSPIVTDNTLADGGTGVALNSSEGTLSGTDVRGHSAGVVVRGGAPALTDNSITGNEIGLSLSGRTSPTLSGNYVCDNVVNLKVREDTEVATDGNEICEDPAATE